MLQGWVVIAVALAYIGLLFLIASYGDRTRRLARSRMRLMIFLHVGGPWLKKKEGEGGGAGGVG